MEVFRQRPKGLMLIVLSAIATSIYNVAIKAVFQPESQILGIFNVETVDIANFRKLPISFNAQNVGSRAADVSFSTYPASQSLARIYKI